MSTRTLSKSFTSRKREAIMAGGVIDRGDVGALIPEGYVTDIITSAAATSLALSTFRRVVMPGLVSHLPVLDVLPVATWVNGEVADPPNHNLGKKTVTDAAFSKKVLTAEEVAAVIVVPEAVVDDAGGTRLWDILLPQLASAVGRALDAAVFFGAQAPASFPAGGIEGGAVAAGNVVALSVGAQPDADDFNTSLGHVEADGYVNRVIYSGTRGKANFRGWNAGGVPIYLTDLRNDSIVDSLYGIPVEYDEFGLFAANDVAAINGDSQMAILGVRQDMTLKFTDTGIVDVSAAQDGSQPVNLFTQDAVAYRIVARFGFVVANPVTASSGAAASRYPFSVIQTPAA
jgi:HK97 family phage major capsid protein